MSETAAAAELRFLQTATRSEKQKQKQTNKQTKKPTYVTIVETELYLMQTVFEPKLNFLLYIALWQVFSGLVLR